MNVASVTELAEEDQKRVLHALTLAFVADPVARWMYPEAETYLAHFPAFARAFGGRAFEASTAWMAGDAAGASLWYPSSVHPDGDAIAGVMFETVDEAKHPEIQQVLEQMDAFHPEEPHWYLSIIGVDAAHQGKGLGARLMQDALARCDEEGLIAYLESSNPANISLYLRHGFEVVGEIRIPDGPVITPMLRRARRR